MLVAVAQHNLVSGRRVGREWMLGEQFGVGQEGNNGGQQRREVAAD